MKTMKMSWNNPAVGIEKFVPQYCVGVCFDLHCNIAHQRSGNLIGYNTTSYGYDIANHVHAAYRNGTGCGHDENQVIRIDATTHEVTVHELNAPTVEHDLLVVFTSPLNLTSDMLVANPNMEIKWETRAHAQQGDTQLTTYYHVGRAIVHTDGIDANHS